MASASGAGAPSGDIQTGPVVATPSFEGPGARGVVVEMLPADCEWEIRFVERVFKGKLESVFRAPMQRKRLQGDDNQMIMHAVMHVNGGDLYLADHPNFTLDDLEASKAKDEAEAGSKRSRGEGGAASHGAHLPHSHPGASTKHINLQNPYPLWERAMAEGDNVEVVEPMQLAFWGALYGVFRDRMGFVWSVMGNASAYKPDKHKAGSRGFAPHKEKGAEAGAEEAK